MRPSWADIGERVGGRFALSWMMIAGSAPFLIFGLLATEQTDGDPRATLGVFVAGFASHLMMGAMFGLAALTIFRHRRHRTIALPVILGFYFVVGQVRMATLVGVLEWWGVAQSVPVWARVVTSAFLFPLAFGFNAYSLESLQRYVDQRSALVRSLVEAEHELGSQTLAVDSLRDAFLSSVDQEITEVNQEAAKSFDELAKRVRSGDNPRPELDELLEKADSQWRAISHSTWARAQIDMPRPRVREFVDALATSRPLSAWATGLGGVFLFSISLARILPLTPALLTTLAWLVIMLSLQRLVNWLPTRVPRHSIAVFLVGFLVLLTGAGMFALVPGIGSEQLAGPVSLHFSTVFTAVLVGTGPALAKSQESVLAALQRHLDDATIRRLRTESELVILARKVAARLHARSRGYFLAHVLRLQRALDVSDRDVALAEIAKIQQGLREDRAEESAEVSGQPRDLDRFLANWRGLVQLKSNLHTVPIDPSIRTPLESLVMEAVNDAVRHGQADWIDIALEPLSGYARLVVQNNGTPFEPGAPGMGSGRLDQIAPGRWTRDVDVMGFTRLTVELPYDTSPAEGA